MSRFLALLAAVGMLGCAPETDAITIDPDFTLEQQSDLILALDDWFSAIPDLRRSVRIDDTKEPTIRRMFGEPEVDGDRTVIGSSFPDHEVRLWTEGASRHQFRAAALHELGHYLGMLGHVEEGNAMAPHYEEDRPVCINAADIEELCRQLEERGASCASETTPSCP